eukprot:gene3017-5027_t
MNFSSFTEFRKHREKEKEKREALKRFNSMRDKRSSTSHENIIRRQVSEPIIERNHDENTFFDKEKKIATLIIENEGHKAGKKVNLDSIISVLCEEWEKEKNLVVL